MSDYYNQISEPITKPSAAVARHRWMDGAIVYHIYPRSLQDSNGDGIGDLQGIIQRLDYLKDLGVNAIWLSPFYLSPMADFGYDVADYCAVDPMFGTLDDFKQLQQEASARNIKIIIDLVPNHTSDEHVWFQQSKQSRENDYADWYIWRDPRPGSELGTPLPPNNWLDALTGRSSWEWVEERQQFYLHSFHAKQPDLNWSNPDVREAIKQAMRYWLDLGVSGFRVDAVYWMAKDPLMRDDAPAADYIENEDGPYESLRHNNSCGWPAVYAYLSEMAQVLKEEPYLDEARFMVTEAYPERHNAVAAYLNFYMGVDRDVAAPFNFEGVSLPWEADAWHRFLKTFHATLDAFGPNCVASYAFGNHDMSRLASRIGEQNARSAAVMLLTLPGMSFIYYGEELGMQNVAIPADQVQDPAALGDPAKGQGRDPERTPMQWTAELNGGFTTGKPWLPLSEDAASRNVAVQSDDPASSLSLYRRLGQLRNKSEALRYGGIDVLDLATPHILGYVRRNGNEHYLVLVNFDDSEQVVDFGTDYELHTRLISSSDNLVAAANEAQGPRIPAAAGRVLLLPHEAVVYTVTSRAQSRP
jgi:alpha-glucosidase